MATGKYFGRARQSFIFWGFFFLLSFQLLCRMPNPPWTSGEVPGHRATCQVGSTLHSSAEFLLVPAVMAQRVSKTQNPGQERKTIVSGPARPQRARWKPPGISIRAQEGQALQQSISDTRGPELPEPGRDPGRDPHPCPGTNSSHPSFPFLNHIPRTHFSPALITIKYPNLWKNKAKAALQGRRGESKTEERKDT